MECFNGYFSLQYFMNANAGWRTRSHPKRLIKFKMLFSFRKLTQYLFPFYYFTSSCMPPRRRLSLRSPSFYSILPFCFIYSFAKKKNLSLDSKATTTTLDCWLHCQNWPWIVQILSTTATSATMSFNFCVPRYVRTHIFSDH